MAKIYPTSLHLSPLCRYCLALVACLLFGISSAFAQQRNIEIGNFYYNLDPVNKLAEITQWKVLKGDVVLPNTVVYNGEEYSVEYLAEKALYGAKDVVSLTLPANIQFIGNEAFTYCSSLTAINVDTNNRFYSSVEGLLCDKAGKHLIVYPEGKSKDAVLPEGINSVGANVFKGYSNLNSITFPKTLKSIGASAFYKCTSLTKIELPEGFTTLEKNAFFGCDHVTTVALPKTLTTIGMGAFRNFKALESLVIPENVVVVGPYAFYGCEKLKDVYIASTFNGITPLLKGNKAKLHVNTFVKQAFAHEEHEFEADQAMTLFVDKAEYITANTVENVDFVYRRTFVDKQWQPLFVPFNVDVEKLRDRLEFAVLDEAATQKDAIATFKMLSKGSIPAWSIALVRAKTAAASAQDFQLKGVTMAAFSENDNMQEKEVGSFVFYGNNTYFSSRSEELAPLTGSQALYNDNFTDAKVHFAAQRWFVKHKDLSDQQPIKLVIINEDGTLGIETHDRSTEVAPTIYTLDGVRQRQSFSTLPKGIYIVDGKKVIK